MLIAPNGGVIKTPGGGVRKRTPGGGGSGRALLQPSDINFLGYYRFPTSGFSDLWFTGGNVSALRTVSGNKRLIVYANESDSYGFGQNVILGEVQLPAAAPTTNPNTAPVATLIQNYGRFMDSRTIVSSDGNFDGVALGSMVWDDEYNGVWWNYGPVYVPTYHNPTVCFTHINDTTGVLTTYGPWRTQLSGLRTRGHLHKLPDAFAAAYTGGKKFAVSATMNSGVAGAEWGANFSAMGLFNPFTTPADPTVTTEYSITNQVIQSHPLTNRQARDTRYKTCGWSGNEGAASNQKYNCALYQAIYSNPAVFGGFDPSSGENDFVASMTWVDTGTKHGVVHFGQLATTPLGYTPPGTDPDGLVHMWYGNAYHGDQTGSGYTNQACCHGQPDPFWGTTGPGTHYRVPHMWIYDPTHYATTAQGLADPWSLSPQSITQWLDPTTTIANNLAGGTAKSIPAMPQFNTSGFIGGGIFDAATGRLYVRIRNLDTNLLYARPVIGVFQVS